MVVSVNNEDINQMTYEQAFKALEEIVVALEQGDHSLEEALQLYEKGQALAQHCARLLDQAELKVKQLSGDTLINFEDEP